MYVCVLRLNKFLQRMLAIICLKKPLSTQVIENAVLKVLIFIFSILLSLKTFSVDSNISLKCMSGYLDEPS